MFIKLKYLIALKIPFLRRFILTEKESIDFSIYHLRQTFAFFGHDLPDFNNQELIDSIHRSASLFKEFGVSSDELSKALTNIP